MPNTQGQGYTHENQHDQQLRLGPNSQHGVYTPSNANSLRQPAMDETQYDFSFLGVPDHGPVIGLDQVGFGGQHGSEFSQDHGMPTSGPLNSHSMAALSAMSPDFGAESSHHSGGGANGADEGAREPNSPETNSFDGGGTDEYGLQGSNKADDTDAGHSRDDKNASIPAWSELKTKAGKDRKRLPLACIACRRKKIRCSGEKPACKHCLRSRIPCVYKVNTRKAAPRTDYMAMLDKRLKRMEDRVIKIVPKSDERQPAMLSRAALKPNIGNTTSSTKPPVKKRGAEEAFGSDDLEAWADTTGDGGKAKGEENLQPAVGEHPCDDSVLSREGAEALPPKEVQEHLAQIFFDNVYGQSYLLLHKPSYMRKLRNNTLPPVLVLSVCAVAARFSPDTAAAGAGSNASRPFLRGEEWASHARDIITRRYEWPNTTVLTCILILGLHEFGTCHGGRSWALGGQAIRMAFALQLHKDLDYEPFSRGPRRPLSFIDREIRRRIMWACFLMDRFNSSGSDRPMFIKEETIQIQLPVKESLFQLDSPAVTEKLDGSVSQTSPGGLGAETARDNMGVAAYTVRAIAIWGRIVSYLHQGGKETDSLAVWNAQSQYWALVQQLEQLQKSLLPTLQYNMDNLDAHLMENTGSQFLLMHLSIQQNILFLHKAGVAFGNGSPTPDRPADFVSKATSTTVVAANRVSEILKVAEQKECPINTPFAGYCAFSATNIHIMGIFSGNATVKAAAEVYAGINIKFLRKTMRYWGMFHWMVEDIRTQYKRALEASRTGKMAPQLAANWPVLQYSDWFNRYPHGVSDFDVVEPTSQARKEKGDDAVLEQKPELQSVGEYFTSLASPSSAEAPTATAKGAPNKRKLSTKKSTEKATARRDSAVAVESSSRPQPHPQPQIVTASTSHPTAIGAQSSGSGAPSFTAGTILRTHGQNYTNSVSPMSPVQMSPFPSQSAGQSPFLPPDMMHMANMQHQRPGEMPAAAMEAQYPLGGYTMAPAQGMPDVSVGWNGAPRSQDPKVSQASGQGHIAAEGLKDFSGSDLPAGWFMPFNMEPPEQEYSQPNAANGVAFGGFGPNGMALSNLDGLQHSL